MHHRAICWETRVCAPNLVSVTTMKPCYSLIHQHNHYHHNPSSMRSSCLSWYPGANWLKRTLGAIRGYSLCIGFPNTQSKRSSGWYLALSMTFERCYFHKGWMLMFFPESTWTTVFCSSTLTLMRSAFSFVRISFPGKMFGVQETLDHIISLKMMKSLKDILSLAPWKLIFLPPKPMMNYIYLSICLYRSRI